MQAWGAMNEPRQHKSAKLVRLARLSHFSGVHKTDGRHLCRRLLSWGGEGDARARHGGV